MNHELRLVTLVYAAKNKQENHALVCRDWLKRKIEGGKLIVNDSLLQMLEDGDFAELK